MKALGMTVAMLVALFPVNASAEWGIGDELCRSYTQAAERSFQAAEVYHQWMMGYMTSIADYVEIDPKFDYLYRPIVDRVEHYCQDSRMRFGHAVALAVRDVYRPAREPVHELGR